MNNQRAFTSLPMLLKGSVLMTLLLSSGCFYFIEEGKGGVAERFPVEQHADSDLEINSLIIAYPQRLETCQQQLAKLQTRTLYQRHPVRFHDIATVLVRSQRMYQAQFYLQAINHLQRAETLLSALEAKASNTQLSPANTFKKTQVISF